MRKFLLTMVAMAVLGAGGAARAQGAPAAPAAPKGFHTHDGFFLQMDLGLGALSSKSGTFTVPLVGTGELKFSGTAGEFSLALGGALTPNFILAGHFWGMTVTSPDVEFAGQTGSATDTTQTLSGVGLNLTYYFMPLNVYVSATPSIGMLSLESDGSSYETKNGFALRLAVGKEWWVSDNWGLGLNLQYAYAGNDDKDGVTSWKSNWFGVAFSATYN
jgi:hypothetical protein